MTEISIWRSSRRLLALLSLMMAGAGWVSEGAAAEFADVGRAMAAPLAEVLPKALPRSAVEVFVEASIDTSIATQDTISTNGGLRPGDIVRLRIWREPDLSNEFQVDAHGVVVFPKIGEMRVGGIAPDELRDLLIERYQRYLRNPSIEVTFLRRINVLGSVRNPGLISVDPTMAVADVLALAGGVTSEGRQDRIQLLRGGEVLTADITERTRIADLPLESGDQLYVPERSWFSRHGIGASLVSAGLSLMTVLITIAVTK